MDKNSPQTKSSAFKPSIKVTFVQVIVIVLTLSIIFGIPLGIQYFTGQDSVSEETTAQQVEIPTEEFIVTLPITGTNIDLTVVKKNPQLITYAGLAFISISLLVGISLLRNALKKR